MIRISVRLWLLVFLLHSTNARAQGASLDPERKVLLVVEGERGTQELLRRELAQTIRSLGWTPVLHSVREGGGAGSLVLSVQSSNTETGVIRTTKLLSRGFTVDVALRTVKDGASLYRSTAKGYGYGATESEAVGHSIEGALSQIHSGIAKALKGQWDPAKPNEMAVHISGAPSFSEVGAVLQRLAATSGVVAVHVAVVKQSEVRLVVRSANDVTSVVGSLRRTRLSQGSLSVDARGQEIFVVVRPAIQPATSMRNG